LGVLLLLLLLLTVMLPGRPQVASLLVRCQLESFESAASWGSAVGLAGKAVRPAVTAAAIALLPAGKALPAAPAAAAASLPRPAAGSSVDLSALLAASQSAPAAPLPGAISLPVGGSKGRSGAELSPGPLSWALLLLLLL
jgi:hypothetical protein